jgi:hypothetical protein
MVDVYFISSLIIFIISFLTFILNIFYVYIPIGNLSNNIQRISVRTDNIIAETQESVTDVRRLIQSTQNIENMIIPNLNLFIQTAKAIVCFGKNQ